jgi:hypothetical protein
VTELVVMVFVLVFVFANANASLSIPSRYLRAFLGASTQLSCNPFLMHLVHGLFSSQVMCAFLQCTQARATLVGGTRRFLTRLTGTAGVVVVVVVVVAVSETDEEIDAAADIDADDVGSVAAMSATSGSSAARFSSTISIAINLHCGCLSLYTTGLLCCVPLPSLPPLSLYIPFYSMQQPHQSKRR